MSRAIEVGDIFRAYGETYRSTHRLSFAQHKALTCISACRTSQLGGHVDQCDSCDHLRISYNSCRNRHCPKCQSLTKERWLEARKSELLAVKHFHIVFTLPHQLHPLIRSNESLCYNLLFQAASQTLIQLGKENKYLHAQVGLLAVLHTWGQNLMYHPHLHCLVPAGGLSLEGDHWIRSRKRFFLPVKVISRLFRGKFLAALKAKFKQGELAYLGQIAYIKGLKELNDYLRPIYRKEWVVYCKAPFSGPEQVINYLGRYTHRVAISNERITHMEKGKVNFSYKDYADGAKRKCMSLEVDEFIRRFLLHILPKGLHKIRYYGLLASRNRKTAWAKARKLLGQAPVEPKEKLPWFVLMEKLTGINPFQCPCCQKGKMRFKQKLMPKQRAPPTKRLS
ncbi:MAG: IS91 family transposase [Bacteroidota bacterium]